MFCKDYRQPLTDAAASGAALLQPLRAHLKSCSGCQSAFTEEQSLFAALDASLCAVVNAELPATLLPRVRAELTKESQPNRWYASWKFAGGMGIAAAAGLALVLLVLPRGSLKSETKNTTPLPVVVPVQKIRESASFATARPKRLFAAPNPPSITPAGISHRVPEVLVPSEEREALASFASHLQGQPRILVALATEPAKSLSNDLKISPVEIARLELKPLEQSAADRSDR